MAKRKGKAQTGGTAGATIGYEAELWRMADTYRAWRGEKGAGEYADVPGFCRSVLLEEVRKHGHVLTPVATSAPRCRKTMANRSMRRCGDLSPSSASSRRRRSDSMQPLLKI